jgi:hypothetical protein
MPVPDFSFLADDIVWAEVPLILWIVAGVLTMLVSVLRFGWGRGRDVLVKYRGFWAVSLVIALVLTVVLWAGGQG